MSVTRHCVFYRNSDSLCMGCGIGYCDFDSIWAICDGDTKFCEKPDDLSRHLLGAQKRKTGRKFVYSLPQAVQI